MKPRQLASGEFKIEPPPGERLRSVVIPFVVFTAIWGSTWIVIRGQLGVVSPQWSVTYRFAIASVAMAVVAAWSGQSLRVGPRGVANAARLDVHTRRRARRR